MVQTKDEQIQVKVGQIQVKDRELQEKVRQLQAKDEQIQVKVRQLQAKDRELQEKDGQIQVKKGQLQEVQQALKQAIATRDDAKEQLQMSEQLVSEFRQSLQQKEKTISDLQHTISENEKKIQQLEQQDTANRPDLPQQLQLVIPQKTEPAVQKDIRNMKWRKGKNAPETMDRLDGAAVVYDNTAYFTDGYSRKVYSYRNIQGEEEWSQLPHNPYIKFGIVVIDSLLTSVGGYNEGSYTNTLLSLTGDAARKQWSEIFPPMPTPRGCIACVSTKQALIVAGERTALGEIVETVEIMNINTKQWMTVTSFPYKSSSLSATSIGDMLYITGNLRSVFTCSIPDLLSSTTTGSSPVPNVLKSISNLPVTHSTLVSFGGHPLAIGGDMGVEKPTSDIYRYDFNTDSWTVAGQLKKKRFYCLAVALGDCVAVVGGWSSKFLFFDIERLNSVEIFK